MLYCTIRMTYLGEHRPGRIKPGRFKRAALSLQNHSYYISLLYIYIIQLSNNSHINELLLLSFLLLVVVFLVSYL